MGVQDSAFQPVPFLPSRCRQRARCPHPHRCPLLHLGPPVTPLLAGCSGEAAVWVGLSGDWLLNWHGGQPAGNSPTISAKPAHMFRYWHGFDSDLSAPDWCAWAMLAKSTRAQAHQPNPRIRLMTVSSLLWPLPPCTSAYASHESSQVVVGIHAL